MALGNLFHMLQSVIQRNSTSILTGVGVAGTVSTSVLTARASFRAAETLREEKARVLPDIDLETTYKIKLVWKMYIPPAGVGIITISSIILANRVAGKHAAALAAAYSVSERAFAEYREKVIEKIGAGKESDIHDMVAQARMSKDPVNTREIILAGTGEVLCYDILTGRYFQSSAEEIRKAENTINFEIVNFTSGVSLSKFYEEIGLPATGFSDAVGFNTNRRVQVRFSTQMSTDDRPCLAIDFLEDPIPNYWKLWE